jgi:putative transposase
MQIHLKEIKGFRLLYNYHLKRWEVHVVVEKEKEVSIKSFAGIDLGMKRLAYIRQLGENRVLSFPKEDYDFFHRMHVLNNRIARLQRLGKIKALKKLRNKRRNIARDFRWKLAKEVSSQITNTMLFVGYPKHLRDSHYKGNGNRNLRKRVNRWAFKEFGDILILKLKERNYAELIGEAYSTKTCCICGSRKTEINDRDFHCQSCGINLDRDENGAINILKKGLKKNRAYEVVWPVLLQQLKAAGLVNHTAEAGAAVTQPLSVDDRVKALEHTTSLRRASPVGVGCPPF